MWHPEEAVVSKIRCFAPLQILRTPRVEPARLGPCITLNVADVLRQRSVDSEILAMEETVLERIRELMAKQSEQARREWYEWCA
jgi:hypothetical protein